MVSSKWRTARGDGLLKTETNIKKEKKDQIRQLWKNARKPKIQMEAVKNRIDTVENDMYRVKETWNTLPDVILKNRYKNEDKKMIYRNYREKRTKLSKSIFYRKKFNRIKLIKTV